MKKKEKKTAAQKVAEMTPQQKSNVLKVGLIADAITIVLLVVALLVTIPSLQNAIDATNTAEELSDEYFEEHDAEMEKCKEYEAKGVLYFPQFPSYDKVDEAWEEADAAAQALIMKGAITFGVYLVYFIVLLVVIKKKFPYYSDGAFFYLLFRKDKKAA